MNNDYDAAIEYYEAERMIAEAIMEQKAIEAAEKFWASVEEQLDLDEDYARWMKEQDDSLIAAIDAGEYIPPTFEVRDIDWVPY